MAVALLRSLVYVILWFSRQQSAEMEESSATVLKDSPSLAGVPELAEEEQEVVDGHEAVEVDVGRAA